MRTVYKPRKKGMESWSSDCGPPTLQIYKRKVPCGKRNITEIWRGMPKNSFCVWLVRIVCHLFITVNINLIFPFLFLVPVLLISPDFCLFLAFYYPCYTPWRLLHLGHVFRCKFSSFISIELCEETTGQINTWISKSKREENTWKYRNTYKKRGQR